MLEISRVIEWEMGHRVPNHKSKCKNPHGHRYRLEATMSGPLQSEKNSSSEGMIFDFADFKDILMQEIHNVLDHGFMIYENDRILLDFFENNAQDFIFVAVPFIPTCENIVMWCAERIIAKLPSSTTLSRLRLYETPNAWADYSPNCR